MTTPSTIADWLRTLPDVQEASPLTIKIGRTVYPAASYHQWRTAPDGGVYVHEAIYLVGPLPAAYKRSRRVALTLPGEAAEWYVGGYFQESNPQPQHAPYHPFGPNVLLMPWRVPSGEAIDAHEWPEKKYRRVPVGIERVG